MMLQIRTREYIFENCAKKNWQQQQQQYKKKEIDLVPEKLSTSLTL